MLPTLHLQRYEVSELSDLYEAYSTLSRVHRRGGDYALAVAARKWTTTIAIELNLRQMAEQESRDTQLRLA